MVEDKGLILTLETYAETDEAVSQKFYQCLCLESMCAIKQLQAKIERLTKAINRAITILPVAKISYVMSELEQALKANQ